MGSATTQALTATRAALDAAQGVDLDTARELFAAARIVGGASHLSGALADPTAPAGARTQVVADVFGGTYGATTVSLLKTAAEQRWSRSSDLVAAIEDSAIRAAAVAEPDVDIEGELFEVSQTVASDAELELALGSRLGDPEAKGALADTLFGGHVSAATSLIVSSLVQQPRDRRVRLLLSSAMRTVTDQRGRTVATVVTAAPLSDAQAERLSAALAKKYGRDVSLNAIIDPAVVGGLRVQIADDVIDGSISGRLADLRQRLAG
jgi:F-type H+-transporting ATPase subunit delta